MHQVCRAESGGSRAESRSCFVLRPLAVDDSDRDSDSDSMIRVPGPARLPRHHDPSPAERGGRSLVNLKAQESESADTVTGQRPPDGHGSSSAPLRPDQVPQCVPVTSHVTRAAGCDPARLADSDSVRLGARGGRGRRGNRPPAETVTRLAQAASGPGPAPLRLRVIGSLAARGLVVLRLVSDLNGSFKFVYCASGPFISWYRWHFFVLYILFNRRRDTDHDSSSSSLACQ
jgi:hypothetical protein